MSGEWNQITKRYLCEDEKIAVLVSCTESLHRNGIPKQLFNPNTCLENEIDAEATDGCQKKYDQNRKVSK